MERSWSLPQGHSSTGRASVSKTEGWGFDSLCPCHHPDAQIFMADKIKLALALLLVAAGLGGFYYLGEQPLVLRVLSVLGGVILAVAVAWKTELGGRFAVFLRETIVETKKVVWPSRKETVQTTGIVFAFTVALAAILWLTDKSLEWVLYSVILGWK